MYKQISTAVGSLNINQKIKGLAETRTCWKRVW